MQGLSGPTQAFRYLRDSRFTIADPDGSLAGFLYDNPTADPIDPPGPLGNTLSVNGDSTSFVGDTVP